MQQTFRPLPRYWLTKSVWLLLWLPLAGYLIFTGQYGLAWWPAIFALIALTELYKLWRQEIRLDEQQLWSRFGSEQTDIDWSEVVEATMTTAPNRDHVLALATLKQTVYLTVTFIDRASLWQAVQRYVPPAALEADAYKRLPAYQDWLQTANRLIYQTQQPLSARLSLEAQFLAGLLWLMIVSCSIPLVGNGASGTIFYLAGPIVLLSWYLLTRLTYRLEMTSEAITVIKLWRRQTIPWAEIEYLEHDFGWHRWVVYGRNKRLAVVGFRLLRKKDRQQIREMVTAQLEHRNIAVHRRERILFIRSRNVG